MAKPDGMYKCPACRGEGRVEVTEGKDTDWSSSVSTIVDCSKCGGSGALRYVDGMPYDEYLARKNARERASLEYYDSCFPSSTLIATPYGQVPIGELSVGDIVLSSQDGTLVGRLITRTLVHGASPLVRVELESGNTLICTANHSFLTDKGWLALTKIRSGDSIMQADGRPSCVKSIAETGTMEPVFNLYTQGEHNFIADGCVAHNFTHFRKLRTLLHNAFFDGLRGHQPQSVKLSTD